MSSFFGGFFLANWNSCIFRRMSSVRALLPPRWSVGTDGGRRAALRLPKGVEDDVIFAVVAQSETERGDNLGGARGATGVAEADILGFCASRPMDSGYCERIWGSVPSLVSSGLSVVIPCDVARVSEAMEGEEDSERCGWRMGRGMTRGY